MGPLHMASMSSIDIVVIILWACLEYECGVLPCFIDMAMQAKDFCAELTGTFVTSKTKSRLPATSAQKTATRGTRYSVGFYCCYYTTLSKYLGLLDETVEPLAPWAYDFQDAVQLHCQHLTATVTVEMSVSIFQSPPASL